MNRTLVVARLALALAFAPTVACDEAVASAAGPALTASDVREDAAAAFPDDDTSGWKIGAIERHQEGSETHFCVGLESDGRMGPRASYLFQYSEDGDLIAAYVRGADGQFSLLFT